MSLWTSNHTICGVVLLICLVSVFKNAFIYFEDYADALDMSLFGYSIIMLSCYMGNITSLIFGIFVNKLFGNKYHLTASLSSLLSGILALLYGLTASMPTEAGRVAYGSVIAFLYKNSASVCYSTVVGLANDHSDSHNKGSNISYLQLSWSVSTLLYIPVGYMLQYSSWFVPFCVFGMVLILYCFILQFGFTFNRGSHGMSSTLIDTAHASENTATSDVASTATSAALSVTSNFRDLRKVLDRKLLLILSSIFFCGVASGSILIVSTSFWMEDVYGLSPSNVGWYTLSIFVAEMMGSLIMSGISDRLGIFSCSVLALLMKITACLVIFNFATVVGPTLGGLAVCVVLNFFLFVGWEMFFITQILAMIEFAPRGVSQNIILLSNFAVASVAKSIGTELSSLLWQKGDGLQLLSVIWLLCNIAGAVAYSILYQIKDVQRRDEYQVIPEREHREHHRHMNDDERI